MALPNVYIELVRNGLGLVAVSNDNVTGLIVPGVAVPDKLELNKAYTIYSTSGAAEIGIDAETNKAAFRQISEFYSVAGEGKKLWVMVVAATVKLPELVDTTLPVCPAKKLLLTAGGEISVLGITAGANSGVTLDGLDDTVYSALTKGQVLAEQMTAQIMPFVLVVEGRGMTDSASLKDLSTVLKYRAAVMLGSTTNDGSASVGMLLGETASLPVQRKISRVKNGVLPIDTAYLTDGKKVKEREDLGTLHDKRFIVFRQFPGRAGYYFSGDPTAAATTDDLNVIARIRTIDKAMKIAYNVYVEELDDDVELNDDGTLHPSVAAYLKEKIENQVKGAMKGEISNFKANVDTSINVAAGNAQKVYLDIYPRGYLNPIQVVLGFKTD